MVKYCCLAGRGVNSIFFAFFTTFLKRHNSFLNEIFLSSLRESFSKKVFQNVLGLDFPFEFCKIGLQNWAPKLGSKIFYVFLAGKNGRLICPNLSNLAIPAIVQILVYIILFFGRSS